MRLARRSRDESGVALITALLAVMLMSALMVGMFAALSTDQRSHALDRDQTQAYAAAQAGLEKLTSGLASLFVTDASPSTAQINAVAATPPVIPNFTFTAPGGVPGSGYAITWDPDMQGNPLAVSKPITTGPFTGFNGLITQYHVTITSESAGGAEVRLRRDLQTVAIPVFQFGVFSDGDLSIFAGGAFSFGGRVHTNGNLFVCSQTGAGFSMTFNDRITVVGEVIHNYWANGLLNTGSNPSCTSNVLIPTAPGITRNLRQAPDESSVTGGMPGQPGTTVNPNWTTISTGTYKGYIRTSLTGAKRLDLPLVSQGAKPVDLIKRPAVNGNENVTNPLVYGQRYFSQASVRILLSDRPADITTLPTVTPAAPVLLSGTPAGYGPVDATHPPLAASMGSAAVGLAAFQEPNGAAPTVANLSTAATIQIAGVGPNNVIPAGWKIPAAGNINVATLPFASPNVTCLAKNQTQLIGCTGFAFAPVAGQAITVNIGAAGSAPAGVQAVGNVSAVANSLPNPQYPVGSLTLSINNVTVTGGPAIPNAFSTSAFAPSALWTQSSNGNNDAVLYTCTGYDTTFAPQRFTGCAGTPNNPAPQVGAPITTSFMSPKDSTLIGGYIKVEKQDANGIWSDVTMEFLNLGIGAPNQEGAACADPTPNAILRIQRLRDNAGNAGLACPYPGSTNAYNWWPNTLYDPREGSLRSVAVGSPMAMGGIMQYIALDGANLKRWFAGTIGATGTQALNNNGYIVYFSDRRGNHDAANADVETGEYGFEDNVNTLDPVNGVPDGLLQTGEDVNGDGLQQTYGETPWNNAVNIPAGSVAPYSTTLAGSGPTVTIAVTNSGEARVNKVVLFRRALKMVNGAINDPVRCPGTNCLPTAGLTVVAENPVYVQGDYNAIPGSIVAEPNVPAAIIADSITLLSNGWTDSNDFENPNSWAARPATLTGFRFAALAGRQISFGFCGAACGGAAAGDLFGTDGGTANFLRLLENWGPAGVCLNYGGSLISLATTRQATGTYKFPQNHIYNGGCRNMSFDLDFLDPALLPPGTPMFRDVNTLKFRQILRPNQ